MKIHGLVYIITGAFLVGFSYYTTSINGNLELQKFMLFIWMGYVFISVGVIKLIIKVLSRPRKPKLSKENFSHHRLVPQNSGNAIQNQANPNQQTQTMGQNSNQLIKFCSQCGSALRHFDNFCYKCGSRMFHRK